MNRRIAAAVAAAAALLTGGALLLVTLLEPEPVPLETASAPVAAPSPAAPVPAPRAAPEPAPRARPAPEPAPAPDPVPPPDPIEEAPVAGALRIESDVPGAQVFLDRRFIGTTPLVSEGIEPGMHQLNVSAEGFDSFAESIDVTPGIREISIRFREVRLDAALDVVHRHRFGSCRGRLIATPHGMRYETTNENDAFTAALLDIEGFEVDYLEKNLRVRAGGRQYNFTDPDGDADRLFVFHRDVEQARERLRRGDPPAAASD